MLTLQDCVDLCDITEEEVLAIAEHEHVPEIIAAELAQYIVQKPDGVPKIRRIILDDMIVAREKGDHEHVEKLELVLKHFVISHPEYDFPHHHQPRYEPG